MSMSVAQAPGSGLMNVSPAVLLLPVLAVTTVLWVTTTNPVEGAAGLYAFLLLLLPWGSYVVWRIGHRSELPIFAMVAGAYWVYFGLPLFWGPRGFRGAAAFANIVPPENTVTDTTLMALLGVACLWIGMRAHIKVWVPAHLPDLVDRSRTWTYVRIVLVAGVALGLRPELVWVLGGEGRQLMTTLMTVVPGVAFVLLFDRHLSGSASRADRVALVVAGAARLLGGLASGWLGPTLAWGITCGALVLLRRRRFPWGPVAVSTVLLLFLQVGKNEFRGAYWAQETNAGVFERVQFWVETSASKWGDALQSGDREAALGLSSQTVQRASLLMQVAHVIEMTPSPVPFQNGSTYRSVAVTLIPRVLWANKPTVNEANRFYQVAYGLTTERGLEGVSIAVGSLAEGFINFGWVGACAVMLLIGIILGVYQRTFVAVQSSTLFLAVGLTLIPGFLAIESQLGQYLGGVVQQTLLTLLVFLPFTQRRGLRRSKWQDLTGVRALQTGSRA